MRVTTELFVSAVVRRAFASGGFAAVARRGSAEAGAVMVTLRDRLGGMRLFGPAAQASYGQARPDERIFTQIMQSDDAEEVAGKIEREVKFDPDLWVLDLEVDEAVFSELVPLTTP